MLKLIDILKEQAHFDFCREGQLYYKTDSGFRFHVPVNELGTGIALPTDKAIVFMKWITGQHREAVGELNAQTSS